MPLSLAEVIARVDEVPGWGRYQHDGAGRILFRSQRRPGLLVWQRFVPPARDEGERSG